MSSPENIREIVRKRYAAAATRSAAGDHQQARVVETSCCGVAPDATRDDQGRAGQTSCCGQEAVATTDEQGRVVFGADLYSSEAALGAPDAALAASLGCGVPTAVADLHPGEVVLDLGSGAGADVLISARRVAPGGRAIGLDMTTEMLELARRNAAEAEVANVEFVQGYLEDIPLPDASVDVVISNCVLNLAADKNVVLAEVARVLRPGGRVAFSDVIADEDMDDATKADTAEWTGCIAGALTQAEFTQALTSAGFTDVEIRPTHRVHDHAQAATIRASTEPIEADPLEAKGTSMNTVEVFEPALCCATGVCGEDVDQGLVTFSADLDFVRSQGGDIRRYNLASEPLAFAENGAVKGFLQVVGSKGLPLVLVEGVTAMTGGYPDRAQLTEWSGVTSPVAEAVPAPAGATLLDLSSAAPTSGACCSSSEADSCCSGSHSDTGECCSTPKTSEAAGCC